MTGEDAAPVAPRERLERAFIAVASALRLDAAGRLWRRGGVVIVMYHGFTGRSASPGIVNHEWKHLPAPEFRAHLEFLTAHYRLVPLADVVAAASGGPSLPGRSAVLTIDDGYRGVYTVAYPLLREFGVPATVFLATGFVDEGDPLWTDRVEFAIDQAPEGSLDFSVGGERWQFLLADRTSRAAADRACRSRLKRLPDRARLAAIAALEAAAGCRLKDAGQRAPEYEPLRWDEIREMASSGLVTFGSHTHTHAILSRCTEAQAADELVRSKRIIEEQLGRRCDLFCYPNGRRGDFNDTTRRLVREVGFTCALTTVYGMNPPRPDPYALTRYNLGRPMVPGEVAVRLAGLLDRPVVAAHASTDRASPRGVHPQP